MTEAADILTHLATAIMTKFAGSDFDSAIGGRLTQDWAEDGTEYPYAVFQIVSAPKEKTFSEEYRDTLIQISIFSKTSSSAEVKDAYTKASALFDECSFSMTGITLICMR